MSTFKESVDAARRLSARLKPSRKWQTLAYRHSHNDPMSHDRYPGKTSGQVEDWENDLYQCTVRRFTDGWWFDPASPWVYIGFASIDGQPRHDWRDMQRIKNDICGPEWEAIELLPAESRLMDPSNYYILFCAPKIPIGKQIKRQIAGPSHSLAPQRPWAKGEEPADAGEFLKETRFDQYL